MQRRHLVFAALPLGVGCATPVEEPAAAGAAGAARPTPVRRVQGGFLSPTVPGAPLPGTLPRPGTGMFVRLQMPTALALRGFDLAVVDAAAGRLWRVDLSFQSLTPVAGAPVGPDTLLALGADRSLWVLDPPARQVLRFGLDGRLMQTWRSAGGIPAGMAVLDGGATLAMADTGFGQWLELRSGGAVALPVLPQRASGERVLGMDGLAPGRSHLFVLDRGAAAVHRVQRDGLLLETLGVGTLRQPMALAVDRHDRVWVLEAGGRSVVLLASGQPPLQRTATELGAQLIGGLAVDERSLALSDRVRGEVLIRPLPALGEAP